MQVFWDEFFTGRFSGLDYGALFDRCEWVRAMAVTPQDSKYHSEGDVWTHTQMVCDALTRDPEWLNLASAERRLLLTAALLHDVGKPEVTFTDRDRRIRSPEHALRGETIARRVLWQMEENFSFREQVAALVRHHMQPRYVPEQKDPRRRVFAMSWELRCDLLAMLARADARGRIARDEQRSLAFIDDFVAICRRHHCLSQPYAFTSEHARFLYFREQLLDPEAMVGPATGPTVTIMSGLPGSGKDSWIAQHRAGTAVVSLDDIRLELGILPAQPQDSVIDVAHDRALMLIAAGTSFVWNATTLSRWHRRRLIDLLAGHDPRIEFVHVDAPPSLVFARNRVRPARAIVPDEVIWRMTNIWQPPTPAEAHYVHYVIHEPVTDQRLAS